MSDEGVKPRLMAVLVVYERDLGRVLAWETLRGWLGARGTLGHVLIYDNSRTPRADPGTGVDGCQYVHDPSNGGTAAAYMHATRLAGTLGFGWLLLLDHDTRLPENFLTVIGAALDAAVSRPATAALLPWIRHGADKCVSPSLVKRTGTLEPLAPGRIPSRGGHLSGIASGSVLRVSALAGLLPFPESLWLDYVDHWIFTQLYLRGRDCVVLDLVLEHDLSIMNPATLSAARLVSVLEGEAIFHRLLGRLARAVYPWRLLWRILRLAQVSPKLALQALKWSWSRALRTP